MQSHQVDKTDGADVSSNSNKQFMQVEPDNAATSDMSSSSCSSSKLSSHFDRQSATSDSQTSSRHQISVTHQPSAVVHQIP